LRSNVKSASLEIHFQASKKIISALVPSLSPEMIKSKRLTVTVTTANHGKTLVLKFVAKDLVSLRAGMNTILRLILSALKSIDAVSALDSKISKEALSQKD
jgi:tRNA threonylcarbamoyladenosine modification (KEOPS) complex  Pcc1 subunit